MSDYTRDEWLRRRALAVQPRLFHKSCDAYMIPHPTDPLMPSRPFVSRGITYVKPKVA